MAIAVWLCFICDSVAVTVVYKFGSNLDYTEAQAEQLSDCQLYRVRIGSQMQLLAWYVCAHPSADSSTKARAGTPTQP